MYYDRGALMSADRAFRGTSALEQDRSDSTEIQRDQFQTMEFFNIEEFLHDSSAAKEDIGHP
jgi:hypothetical protein